jgi:hypothetical protein
MFHKSVPAEKGVKAVFRPYQSLTTPVHDHGAAGVAALVNDKAAGIGV